MHETLRSLAKSYRVSLDDALRELEDNGIIVLSADMPIVDSGKLARYKHIISSIQKSGTHLDEIIPSKNEPVVSTPYSAPTKTMVSPRKGLLGENSRDSWGSDHSHRNDADKNERQKQLLGRDYVIFTHMALRKPIAEKILKQVIEVKINRKTKTRIVVCKEAVDYVLQAASFDGKIKPVADALELLQKYDALTTLSGKISEENHTISSFIRKLELNKSILVVGINRGLSTFIRNRNRVNQDDQSYVRIFERDITSKGFLANPQNQMMAFENPDGKAKARFSEQPKKLVGQTPISGQYVYLKQKNGVNKAVLLEEELGKGGEAHIYKVFSGMKCVKIFLPESNSEMKFEKIKRMCEKYSLLHAMDTPIMERIAWPERLVYNDRGEAIGYIMKIFEGTTPFSDFCYDTFDKIIPGLNKMHQVTMAVNFAELLDFMHHNNVILCDINRGNILFDSELVAYLVDLDSAQIADTDYYYPSNVGMPEFRSPEHIFDVDFSFVRKKADDVWILQMLLFHILTPDGDPYATSKVYNDDREIVAKGYYPYQAGDIRAEDDIKGSVWHMIVSHFPKFIKELFWNSLHGDGKYFKEKDRRSSYDWLYAMVRYQELLPSMIESDPESGKYMPDTYRKHVQTLSKVDVSGGSLEELLKRTLGKDISTGWKDL